MAFDLTFRRAGQPPVGFIPEEDEDEKLKRLLRDFSRPSVPAPQQPAPALPSHFTRNLMPMIEAAMNEQYNVGGQEGSSTQLPQRLSEFAAPSAQMPGVVPIERPRILSPEEAPPITASMGRAPTPRVPPIEVPPAFGRVRMQEDVPPIGQEQDKPAWLSSFRRATANEPPVVAEKAIDDPVSRFARGGSVGLNPPVVPIEQAPGRQASWLNRAVSELPREAEVVPIEKAFARRDQQSDVVPINRPAPDGMHDIPGQYAPSDGTVSDPDAEPEHIIHSSPEDDQYMVNRAARLGVPDAHTLPPVSQLPAAAQSAELADLRQQYEELRRLYHEKPTNKNSRLKGMFKSAGLLILNALASGQGLGPAAVSGIVGLIGGGFDKTMDERLSRQRQIGRREQQFGKSLKIADAMTEIESRMEDIQNKRAARAALPVKQETANRKSMYAELRGRMKITGDRFDPADARSAELAEALSIVPRNKPGAKFNPNALRQLGNKLTYTELVNGKPTVVVLYSDDELSKEDKIRNAIAIEQVNAQRRRNGDPPLNRNLQHWDTMQPSVFQQSVVHLLLYQLPARSKSPRACTATGHCV